MQKLGVVALGFALLFGTVSGSWAQAGGAGGAGGAASGTGATGGMPGTGSSATPGSGTNSPTTNPSR